MLKEFKVFLMRGNVLDLAIGVIIGAAFGKIVTSVVEDLLMPPVGMAMSGIDFKNMSVLLKAAVLDPTGKVVTPAVEIKYGNFITTVLQFVIVAFCIFLIVKAVNKMMPPPPAAEEPVGPTEVELLTEIRDSLKAKG